MKKVALLIATALIVSAPLIAATPTLTYAAAKAKNKNKSGGNTETNLDEVNGRFARALGDLIMSIGQPWPTSDAGKGKTRRGGSHKGKKT